MSARTVSFLRKYLWFLGAYAPILLAVAGLQASNPAEVWVLHTEFKTWSFLLWSLAAFTCVGLLARLVRKLELQTPDRAIKVSGFEVADLGVGDFILGASTLGAKFFAKDEAASYAFLALFLFYGAIYAKVERLEMNPTLLFLGYRVYKVGLPNGQKIHLVSKEQPVDGESIKVSALSQFCYIATDEDADEHPV
jgi:hypothetical protein